MDELERLVANAEALVAAGYYDVKGEGARSPSFLEVLGAAGRGSDVIAEIKFASPAMRAAKDAADFERLLARIAAARPLGISILAEPRIFGGHIDFVWRAARTGLPVLMKDIVIDPRQIEAAAASGASAVLLLEALDRAGPLQGTMETLIDEAHERDVDVVLEVHTPEEWDAAVATDADILGVNNRNLRTMGVDLSTVPSILAARRKDRPVIAMSGIESRAQVEAMLRAGADAVLVGTSIMVDADPVRKLEELQHG